MLAWYGAAVSLPRTPSSCGNLGWLLVFLYSCCCHCRHIWKGPGCPIVITPFPAPVTLSTLTRHKLTWIAATERLAEAAAMTMGERNKQKPMSDGALTVAHAAVGAGPGGDFLRLLAGADSAAWQVRTKYYYRAFLRAVPPAFDLIS